MTAPTQGTILVIDDDPMIRLMARETLADAGFRVVDAPDAHAGLAQFEAGPADLVLLDLLMPGMNGYEACRSLRAKSAGQNIPIIVMTGLDDRESIQQAYESGATDFITKPMVWDLLPYRARYALRASQALRDSVQSQALLVASQRIAQMGSWEWRSGSSALSCSDELQRIHGHAALQRERDFSELLAHVHPEDRDAVELALQGARLHGKTYAVEFRIVRPDLSVRTVKEQTDVELDAAGRVIAVRGIRHDITQQIEAARRIHALAYIDSLTGLPNRALFRDTVQQWLGFAARRDLRCAVVVVALPRLKVIADALGPDVADAALKMVGGRLRDALRAEDLKGALDAEIGDDPLARLGADEFGVLLVDIGNSDNVLRVARRLGDRLGASLVVQGQELALGACLGIALTPGDGADADTLLRNAGTAVRAAQAAGQSRVCLYSESMSRAMQRRHTLETELRHAIEQGELRVVYQAKVDARTGRIVGAEALARWQHPQRGSISPAEFIPIAEESGLIVALTHVVLDLVGAQLAAWRDCGLPPLRVSVNLDGQSLQSDGLVERIRSTLTRFALPTSLLELEVTETGLMQDLDASTRVLRDLKGLGIKLAIDDFGTGYSSLTYLKRFPLDILKIDRSFIKDLPSDANDAALTAAIVAMGQSLQLELIAEGVETWEQADFLATLGCHVIQGFLFSKPLPADDFARLLVRGVPSPPAAAAAPQAAVA